MVTTFEQDMALHLPERNKEILGFGVRDVNKQLDDYFAAGNLADKSVNANANVLSISPNNCATEIANPLIREYFFRKLFYYGSKRNPNFSLDKVWDGTIYVHNSTKLQPYCFGTSATEIATEGRPYGKLRAKPPKRLESFMGQYTEFIMDNSQQFAGAVASTDLMPWIAWFVEKGKSGGFSKGRDFDDNHFSNGLSEREYVKKEDYYCHDFENGDDVGCYPNRYSDKEIENIFQSFVHILSNNFRVGGDAPFTNVSVNSEQVYKDIFAHYTFPDGKTVEQLLPTIFRVQKIVVEFMIKGQPNGLPYHFPILTANFKTNEPESEWFKYITERNATGIMNVNYSERFSMCCRLSLDFDYKQNSFGGGGVKIGSMCVVNLNLPRLAYEAMKEPKKATYNAQKTKYFELLDAAIYKGISYLTAYRDMFEWLISTAYLTFFKEPAQWYDISMFFATVGFCGIYDAAEIMFPESNTIAFKERVEFMEEVIKRLVEKTKVKSNGIKFNVEEVPSEAAAGKMAKMNADYGETKQYYSNQFVPLAYPIDLWERIKIESRLQSSLTGGGMTFLNFESKLTPQQSYALHKSIKDFGFKGQFCINYGYSSCGEHTVVGRVDKCPTCGKPTDFYTRVVGYLAKETNAAKSKVAEIKDRRYYGVAT